jgi:predicted transglutaminase-like cysteine proteinase
VKRRRFLLLAAASLPWPGPGLRSQQPLVDAAMLTRLKNDYSERAWKRGRALNRLVEQLRGQPVEKQLDGVNRFFNQFEYVEDIDLWGQKDYWATPEEFLGRARGDCEDFVIAKYFTLRELGVPDERLYLTYVKHLTRNIAHMVLSYFEQPGSLPLILDNYQAAIEPADRRRDLLPVYSFNAQSLFLNNASAGLGRQLPTGKIKNSKWRKLLADLQRDKP